MFHKKALERWETKVGNCKVTPQAKILTKVEGPRAPTAVHDPLGITYHPNDKANMNADCLENLWNEN
jgi:hypothetical protein